MASELATGDDSPISVSIDEYQSVSLAVVIGVSDLLGVDPCSLPPITQSINTDALDALYADPSLESDEEMWPRIVFEYCNNEITIDRSGIVIEPGPTVSMGMSPAVASDCGLD